MISKIILRPGKAPNLPVPGKRSYASLRLRILGSGDTGCPHLFAMFQNCLSAGEGVFETRRHFIRQHHCVRPFKTTF